VHLLDKCIKIYKMNSTYYIEIMSYVVVGVRCGAKSK